MARRDVPQRRPSALNCLFIVAFKDDQWAIKSGFSLIPGEASRTKVWATRGTPRGYPVDLFNPTGGAKRTTPAPEDDHALTVALCSDALERRWRFLPDYPPDVVVVDNSQLPGWATWLQ